MEAELDEETVNLIAKTLSDRLTSVVVAMRNILKEGNIKCSGIKLNKGTDPGFYHLDVDLWVPSDATKDTLRRIMKAIYGGVEKWLKFQQPLCRKWVMKYVLINLLWNVEEPT